MMMKKLFCFRILKFVAEYKSVPHKNHTGHMMYSDYIFNRYFLNLFLQREVVGSKGSPSNKA